MKNENSINVLMLRPIIDCYGVTKVTLNLSRQLQQYGCKIYYGCQNPNDVEIIKKHNIQFIEIPFQLEKKTFSSYAKSIYVINKIVKEKKINLIHSHHRWSSFISFFICSIYGIPLLTTYHGIHSKKRKLSIFGDAVISVSEDSKNHLISYFKIDKDKIRVIYNGINLPQQCADITNKCNILSVARLSKEKDHKTLFIAFKKLKQKYPKLRLTLAGDGELKNELINFSKKLDIYDNIKFLGKIENIEDIYQKGGIFVLSSTTEGFPIALLEAMSYGLPVVTTNVGGINKIVQNNINGYIVEKENPEEIYIAVSKLIDNENCSTMFRENGINTINQNFSIDKMAQDTIKLYKEILC